jgi:glycosyltransferase involved in cell wall biosynthesis
MSPAVRIAYLIDALESFHAGTESQLLELVRGLDRRQFQPMLIVLRPTLVLDAGGFLEVPVHVLDITRLRSPGSWFRLARLAVFLRLKRVRLVHIFFNDAAMIGPPACWLGGARTIAARRDMGFWYTPATLAALRQANRFVDRIVVNSEAVRANVITHEHYSAQSIEVIPNGHDPARFEVPPAADLRQQLGIGPADPIVGIVANLRPIKRHTDLLQAFAIVRQTHRQAHLLVIGSGALESELRARTSALGLDSAVHFLGSSPAPVSLIKHCDVCVLTSESEGLSNAVIEYLACGKPTVCTIAGGNPELVQDGDSGFLVPVGDVQALADRITQLLDDPALARRLGARARQTFLERFTVTRMLERHVELYDRLLARRT